jgi:hypothetical protein
MTAASVQYSFINQFDCYNIEIEYTNSWQEDQDEFIILLKNQMLKVLLLGSRSSACRSGHSNRIYVQYLTGVNLKYIYFSFCFLQC